MRLCVMWVVIPFTQRICTSIRHHTSIHLSVIASLIVEWHRYFTNICTDPTVSERQQICLCMSTDEPRVHFNFQYTSTGLWVHLGINVCVSGIHILISLTFLHTICNFFFFLTEYIWMPFWIIEYFYATITSQINYFLYIDCSWVIFIQKCWNFWGSDA